MRSSWMAITLGALVLGVGSGCGSSSVQGDAGTQDGQCTRVPALIEARGACRQDDQCPCGAYCSRGVCSHDCLQDADCEGWCDSTGQCRGAANRNQVPEVRSPTETPFQVDPALVPVVKRDGELTVTLGARQQPLGRVRLEASRGLLVQCGDTYASECELDGPAAGTAAVVRLKVDAADTSSSSWRLVVFHGQQMKTVSFEAVSPPQSSAARSGVYRGTVWSESSAVTLLGNEPATGQHLKDGRALITLPLEARLFDDGTLVLVDARKVFPSPWKFQLGLDGSFSAAATGVDESRRVFLGRASGTTDETATEVAISGVGTLKASGADALTGFLQTTLDGLGLGYRPADGLDERPSVRWGLSLTRVSDIPAADLPGNYVTAESAPVFDEAADRYGHRLPWDATLAGVTLLDDANPSFPSWLDRMQYFLCYDRSLGLATSRSFGTAAKTPLLDYACDDPAPAPGTSIRAFPFFSLDSTVTAGSLLQSCLGDLAEVAAAPPSATCSQNAVNCLTGDSQPRTCVDAPLALRSLAIGLEQLERFDWSLQPYYESKSDPALRQAHRLLQQWLQLHTFVAREATQASDLSFQATAPDPKPALSASLDGWNVVLHPKVAGRLMHWPPALLDEPDYRVGETAVSLDVAQAIGVPVLMLEALAAQVDAAALLVSQVRHTIRSEVPAEVSRSMRAAVVVAPLARALRRRAATAGDPPWERFWQDAEHHLADAIDRLQSEWQSLERGANPLGIEEADLPLYHSGQDASDAIGRFKAISNYLLAPGGGASDPGWATRAVAEAVASSEAARVQWEKLLERKLQSALAQQDRDDRLTQIKQNYGEKILTLCGERMFPTSSADAVLDALRQHPEIGVFNCFMDQQNPACHYDEDEFIAKLTPDDLAYRMCVLGGLQQQFDAKVEFKDDFANDFVKQASALVGPVAQGAAMMDELKAGLMQMGEMIVAAVTEKTWQASGIVTDENLTVRTENPDDLQKSETLCRGLFPQAVPMNKLVASLESSPLDRPECYRGSIGEQALTVRAAAKDIEIANARFQELTDKYTIALNHCLIQESALSQKEEVVAAAGQVVEKVARLQGVASGISRVFDGAIGCVCGSGVDTVTGCANSGLSLVKDGAMGLTDRLLSTEPVTSLSSDFLASIASQMTNALCFNDAQMHLVGADTQARQIERSRLDLSLAMLKLRNAQATLSRLIFEGTGRVAAEQQRTATSLVNETWKDLWDLDLSTSKGAVEKARRDLHVARRATYLAVRAVEYEWQMSLAARGEVLRATRPADLEAVLNGLRTTLAPNNIAGQAPKNANVVLSLKEHVLQLASMKDWPVGQQTWSDSERLRHLLTSPRLAYHDESGAYLGQLMPLAIAPLGVLGLGRTGGVPLLTGSDCAERIWKVNLVLQGEALVDGGSSKTRVDLLQRNVFHSQRCAESGAGESPLQSLSVRPSRNLFQDPVWGRVGGTGGVTGEADKFLRSSIDAYHNVSRNEFEKESYQQGASMELATRCLYGDFALFFSKDILAVDGHAGLHLENLDDVLIRFDYASVTKSW